jgi:hypothetical protein
LLSTYPKLYTHLASTTTNEVNDLDPIVVAQIRRAPLVATHNGAIQLNRNSRGRQVELGDQLGQGKWTGELSGFTVYVNAQSQSLFRRRDE